MQIIIKNENDLYSNKFYIGEINKNEVIRQDVPLVELSEVNNSTEIVGLTDLIINFNKNSNFFTPSIEHKLQIIFANFSIFNKLIDRFRINYLNQDDDFAMYDSQNKKIFIREVILSNNNQQSIISMYRNAGVSNNDIINIVLLHEIGHSIHHLNYLNTSKVLDTLNNHDINFFNDLISIENNLVLNLTKNGENQNLDFTTHIHQSISEGFADLYCINAINKLYSKEQSHKLIDIIKTSRKKRQEQEKEKEQYFTVPSIENYLLNKNNLSIDSFEQLNKNISKSIGNTAKNILIEASNNTNWKEPQSIRIYNRLLGYFNEKNSLKFDSSQKTSNYIINKYKVNLNKHFIAEQEYYLEGGSIYRNRPQIKHDLFSKILTIRESFISKKTNNKLNK